MIMDETNYATGNEQEQQMTYEPVEQMIVSEPAKGKMLSMGKWMVFLGILAIIGGALMIIASILGLFFTSRIPSQFNGGQATIITFVYLICGAIAAYMGNLLRCAGSNYKKAATLNDSDILEEAVSNQNSYFSLSGIITIIILAIYVLLIIFFVLLR